MKDIRVHESWKLLAVGAFTALLTTAALASLTGDLADLFRQTRYAEASDLLRQDGSSDLQSTIWASRLSTDPDEFEQLSLKAIQHPNADPQTQLQLGIERAREGFARGRYQTAVTILDSYDEETGATNPELLLWLGMSQQATGMVRPAESAFEAIPKSAEQYGTARALLAELALRSGRPRKAAEFAEQALDADASTAPTALSVLHRIAQTSGDKDLAQDLAERLRRAAPKSTESAGMTSRVVESRPPAPITSGVPEIEAPASRSQFSLQLGAFRDRALALRLVSGVQKRTEDLRIEVDRTEEPAIYRVVAGSFGTRSQAEAMRDQLRSLGIETFLLTPGRQVR